MTHPKADNSIEIAAVARLQIHTSACKQGIRLLCSMNKVPCVNKQYNLHIKTILLIILQLYKSQPNWKRHARMNKKYYRVGKSSLTVLVCRKGQSCDVCIVCSEKLGTQVPPKSHVTTNILPLAVTESLSFLK